MIEKILTLSTGFITKEDAAVLQDVAGTPSAPFGLLDYSDGFIFQLPEDAGIFSEEMHRLPAEKCYALRRLLARVWNAGIYWLRLDADGPGKEGDPLCAEAEAIVRGLPIFHW